MLVECMCQECGKKFERYPSVIERGRGKYCSKGCMAIGYRKRFIGEKSPAWKDNKEEHKCRYCGKHFIRRITIDHPGIYCSWDCRYKGIQAEGRMAGENHPRWKNTPLRTCETCGKEFRVWQSVINKGSGKYCSGKCYGIARKELYVGEKSFCWKGGEYMRKCRYCSKIFYSRGEGNRGIYCSRECSDKGTVAEGKLKGKNHPQWKGYGTEGGGKRRYESWIISYNRFTKRVMERDNYTCQRCGIRGGKLCAHHIVPWKLSKELRDDVNNAVTLCVECHRSFIHTKKNKSQELLGWREYFKQASKNSKANVF